MFWSGFFVGAVLLSISLGHRGWGVAVTAFVAGVLIVAMFAYFRTDHLKIGGKIYTVSSFKERKR